MRRGRERVGEAEEGGVRTNEGVKKKRTKDEERKRRVREGRE